MTTSRVMTAVFLALIPIALSATGYGFMLAADSRYVQQKAWIQEGRSAEVRRLQYRLDELEYTQTQRALVAKEQWELKRLQSEIRGIRGN